MYHIIKISEIAIRTYSCHLQLKKFVCLWTLYIATIQCINLCYFKYINNAFLINNQTTPKIIANGDDKNIKVKRYFNLS